jgi:hypothetical protein
VPHAQAPQTEKIPGAVQTSTVQMTGEVMWVQGDWLAARMQPDGHFSLFHVQPGREFVIDGQTRHIADVRAGTVLTATVTTRTQSVTLRTTTSLSGTVWYAQGNYVILTLQSGENKAYTVPESFKFMVEGKPASVNELKPGMKVTATKIVEEPETEFSTTTAVTGKAPK